VSKTKYHCSLKVKTFPRPKFVGWLRLDTRRDKHPKKLEAINADTLPCWKVFIASQGHWKWSDNVFPARHSGKCEFCSLHQVNDQLLISCSTTQFFVRNATKSR